MVRFLLVILISPDCLYGSFNLDVFFAKNWLSDCIPWLFACPLVLLLLVVMYLSGIDLWMLLVITLCNCVLLFYGVSFCD